MKTVNKKRRAASDKAKSSRNQIKQVYVFSLVMVVLVVITIALTIWYTLMATEVLTVAYLQSYGGLLILLFIVGSVLLSIGLTYLISILVLRPVNTLINGISKLSEGDYSVRITLGGYEAMKNLSSSFNNLAAELGSTEILRSDFINNFSHEFKTPIMSIRGLVGILQKGGLPEEKQAEYIAVIGDEADRLARLATNVLNLSKIENQNILSDVKRVNVSEQLRDCLLLLEKKWSAKNLKLCVDDGDVMLDGNEDMLKQMWFNLLDNAVKFARDGGELCVSAVKTGGKVKVRVEDEGEQIAPENLDKIFNKFYQQDAWHSREGNGIGLSVAKKVAELHGGGIKAESGEGRTAFTVILPAARQ